MPNKRDFFIAQGIVIVLYALLVTGVLMAL